jgi:hypothetical protein
MNDINPHISCSSEQDVVEQELLHRLGSSICQNGLQKRGVCKEAVNITGSHELVSAVRFMLHIHNSNMQKSIYFAYFHSLMKYGIIF